MEKIKLSQKEKNARLHNAALTNDLAGIANALKEGAQVNSIVEQMSALMLASREGFPFEVSLLLENGADISLKNNEGETARDYASIEEMKELVEKRYLAIQTKITQLSAMQKKDAIDDIVRGLES